MSNQLILIVEDNEVNRVLVRDCCASRDIEPWKRRLRKKAFAWRVSKNLR